MDGIRGFDSLMNKINNLTGTQMDEAAKKATKSVGMAHASAAKLLVPGGIDSGGELRSSIHTKTESDVNGVVCYCYTNSDHAAYVEFGTGPVGEASGGDGSPQKVSYSHGPFKHVSKTGKVYYTDYWTYKSSNGKFYSTHGQEAQPFLYPAAMAVKDQAPKIQAQAFKKYIKGLGV